MWLKFAACTFDYEYMMKFAACTFDYEYMNVALS
jgi:hypothetical protein